MDCLGQRHLRGSAFELSPLAWPTVDRLEVHIRREKWAEVAASLGLEELRLIAVRLPETGRRP
jgi:hypothetical protein